MNGMYTTDILLAINDPENATKRLEIRNPSNSNVDLRVTRIATTGTSSLVDFVFTRYSELATHGTSGDAPTQASVYPFHPLDASALFEIWYADHADPSAQIVWPNDNTITLRRTYNQDPGDSGDDGEFDVGKYRQPHEQIVIPPGTSAAITMPLGQADYRIAIDIKQVIANVADPTRIRPHDLGETLFGHARTASERSLSYLIHSSTAMTSISGAEARHEDFNVDENGTATITYLPNEFGVELAVGTANADRMTYRQRVYNPYNPGCQQRVTLTSTLGTRPANQEVRLFYGDDSDGLGIYQSSAGVYFFVRTSTSGSVVQSVLQEIDVDPAKDHLFTICFEWLGAGGIELFVDHVKRYHQQPGTLAVPFIKRPNLPITCDIRNVGASSAGSVKFYCGKVASEGADDFRSRASTASAATSSIPTTGKMMLQIRPKLTLDIGSITSLANRAIYIPKSVTIQTADGPMYARVFLNGTVGGSPSWTATEDTGIEQDVAGTFTGATGRAVGFGAISTTTGSADIDLGKYFGFPASRAMTNAPFSGGTPDALQIVGYSRAATVNAEAIVTWQRI